MLHEPRTLCQLAITTDGSQRLRFTTLSFACVIQVTTPREPITLPVPGKILNLDLSVLG
jgi:hypothetical protein